MAVTLAREEGRTPSGVAANMPRRIRKLDVPDAARPPAESSYSSFNRYPTPGSVISSFGRDASFSIFRLSCAM